jgi:hypothetical protein
MATPDQVFGRRGLEALRFTHRHLNGHRRAGIEAGSARPTLTIERTGAVAIKAAGGRAATLSERRTTLGTARAERGTSLLGAGAEGAAAITATCIRAPALARSPLETAFRARAGGTGPSGTGAAGTIRAEAVGTPIAGAIGTGPVAGTAETTPFGTGAIGTRTIEAGAFRAALTALGTLGTPLTLRTIGSPLATGLERPGRAERTTAAGTGALALVPSTIKTGAHGRQADGLWVGVLESIQQLGETAGVAQKEPAHHCLKSRGPAIDPRFTAAGAPAGPVTPLPYLL